MTRTTATLLAWAVVCPLALSCGAAPPADAVLQDPSAGYARVALDGDGTPYVLYLEAYDSGTRQRARVRVRLGGTWAPLGEALVENTSPLFPPVLRVDPSGWPLVAYQVAGTDGRVEVRVKRWDGTTWVELGAVPALPTNTNDPEYSSTGHGLAFDFVLWGNAPVVAYQSLENRFGGAGVRVAKWNGSIFEVLGNARVNPVIAAGPVRLALDGANSVHVAWAPAESVTAEAGKVYVQRWNLSTFEPAGPALQRGTRDVDFALEVNAANQPVLAYEDGRGTSTTTVRVHAQALVAGAWQPVAGGQSRASADRAAKDPLLALDGARNPLLAWEEQGTPDNALLVSRVSAALWAPVPDAQVSPFTEFHLGTRGSRGAVVYRRSVGGKMSLLLKEFSLP